MPTIVHETYHAYTDIYGLIHHGKVIKAPEGVVDSGDKVWIRSPFKGYAFYFLDSGHHVVEITPTYPAKELSSQITGELRTMRFEPYIGTS
ncbi:MAG: hypothetical protein ABUK01_15830, partial [Leptospirales bacterium]